jgi:hypothetical protein
MSLDEEGVCGTGSVRAERGGGCVCWRGYLHGVRSVCVEGKVYWVYGDRGACVVWKCLLC